MNPAGTEPERRDNAKPGASPILTHSRILEAGDALDRQKGDYDDTSTTTTALLSTSGVYSAESSSFYEHSIYCWSPEGALSPRPPPQLTDSYVSEEKEEEIAVVACQYERTQSEQSSTYVPLESKSIPSYSNEVEEENQSPLPNSEGRHLAVTPPGQHFIGSDRWGWLPDDFAALDSVLCLQSYLCNPPPLPSSRKTLSEAEAAAAAAATRASPSTSTDSFASTQWDGDEDDQSQIEC